MIARPQSFPDRGENFTTVKLPRGQKAIFLFIAAYIEKHGYSPTIREMAEHFGVHLNAIQGQVNRLLAKGLLRRGPKHARRTLKPKRAR